MSSAMERMWGRMLSLIGIARVTASPGLEGKGTHRLQLRFDDQEGRDGTPVMALYGVSSRPRPGADALVLFLSGDRTSGVVVATNDRRVQIDLAEGEVSLHDDLGQRVHLTRTGIVLEGAGFPVTINADVQVNGTITSTGDQVAGNISQMNHRHRDVEPGGGQSGIPIP